MTDRGRVLVVPFRSRSERTRRRDLQLRLYAMKWPRDSHGRMPWGEAFRRLDGWSYMEGITAERARQIIKQPAPWLRDAISAWQDETAAFGDRLWAAWYAASTSRRPDPATRPAGQKGPT